MKKFFACFFAICVFNIFEPAFSNNFCSHSKDVFSGRWAENISQRVVMDIFPDLNNENYKIFITWREDNLAQKDIYRFEAHKNNCQTLTYKNGVHIYRYFNSDGSFEDSTDYTDGSGIFEFKDNEITWKDNKDNRETSIFIKADKAFLKGTTVKNKMFSFVMPEELKGFYQAIIKKDKIEIYHIDSKKAGFGGFAFGIKAYKNPADHATLPGSYKLGELRNRKGVLYDIVLKQPTDVQYDYTKNYVPDTYKIMYDFGNFVDIQGIKGAQYFKAQGTKGKDLYKNILEKHITAIKEQWDSTKLENENMSYMYNVIAQNHEINNVLNKIGYTYYDTNADGIEELLIGEIADGNSKGIIYDIYTMVDRKPAHVISGGTRNRYFVCDETFICNEYSSGALESGLRVYSLLENSTELFGQVGFKYDGYKNKNKPWFLTYGSFVDSENEWKNIDEKTFYERRKTLEGYQRFDFIPLSKIDY